MARPVFPTLASGQQIDSSKFSIELQDNTIRQEVEGGYTLTRPRTTRRSRKTFKCAYTYIDETDRLALTAFWETVAGNAIIFEWTSPQDGVTYLVRFKGGMNFQYRGVKTTQRWDCSFDLEQA